MKEEYDKHTGSYTMVAETAREATELAKLRTALTPLKSEWMEDVKCYEVAHKYFENTIRIIFDLNDQESINKFEEDIKKL